MNPSNNARPLTRRAALKAMASATAMTALTSGRSNASDAPSPARPTLHVYPDYGWLRGFSVVPSWGARIEDAWWFYDGAKMREEVALATQVHANCIRLWIEFTAWYRDPEGVTASFMDAVAAIDEHGMKTMPCLFNRWHDTQYDYGGTYAQNIRPGWQGPPEYLKALVTPLAADERIVAWDLCNEPQAFDKGAGNNAREYAWLSAVRDVVLGCGAQQPITIGTMHSGNIETYAPLMDVLCGHPYDQTPEALAAKIAALKEIQQRHGKPMLCNECIPGAADDAVRAETARYYTAQLSEAGFGWMGWALREGHAISTRRDRCDGNGIGGVGFHPFFTADGKLRGGLEFLTEKPARLAPWL